MAKTDRVVPVAIFLRTAEREPEALVLGTERRPVPAVRVPDVPVGRDARSSAGSTVTTW